MTPRPDLLELGRSWRQSLGKAPDLAGGQYPGGEEALVLAAHARLPGDVLLILVPGIPSASTGHPPRRRSHGPRTDPVAVAVSRPRIPHLDRRFDGRTGRLLRGCRSGLCRREPAALGGQNLIEAAACRPVVIGPHTFNFAQATPTPLPPAPLASSTQPRNSGAAVAELLDDPAVLATMATAAASFAATHRGATQRTLALIERWRDREGRWPEPDRLPPGRPTEALSFNWASRGIEGGLGEIAAGLIDLILGVQYVDIDAHADFVAQLVRTPGPTGRTVWPRPGLGAGPGRSPRPGSSGVPRTAARRAASREAWAAARLATASRSRDMTRPP